MAGFLAPNYVPEFNPAISTIPLELYTNVIVGKQQAYDKGVANVQSYIHNVTGLEMGRESDKAYYDSKVSELKNNVGKMLTSDFSNQGVVMKAGGMASQLYNDKRIRNSVMSYAYKKDYAEQLMKAQQDGTYAEENAALGLKRIQEWEAGGDDATLGKLNYIAYDNYTPRLTSWLKNINPDVRVDQNSPIGTDGKPVPYILVEGKIQEITGGKIREATEAFFSMDSKASQQRAITAGYRGSQMDDNTSLSSLRSYHQQSTEDIDNQISFYKQRKALVSGDKDKEKVYDENIAKLTQNKVDLDANYQTDLDVFTTDPNRVKTNIWYRQQQQSIASTFSYNQTSQKYTDDPRFDIYKFGVEQDYKERKLQSDIEESQKDRDNALLVAQMKEGVSSATTGLAPGMVPGATPTIVSEVKTPADAARVYEERVNGDVDVANQQLYGMLYDTYRSETNGRMSSAADKIIEKGEDGRYRLRPGVSSGVLMGYLGAIKHQYEEGSIGPNHPSFTMVDKYFGSTDDKYGEYFYRTSVKNKSEWDQMKQSNLVKNGVSVVEGSPLDLDAKRYEYVAESLKSRGDSEGYRKNIEIANRIRGQLTTNILGKSMAGEYAMSRVKESTKPRISVAKDSKEGKDTYANLSVLAVNKINSLPDIGDTKELNSALDKAKGASIVYDNRTDQFTLQIETAGNVIPPLPLTPQEAGQYGGEQLRATANPYAKVDEEIRANNGISNPRLHHIGDEFTVRTKIRLDDLGNAKPIVEYKVHSEGDGAQWKSIQRATGAVTSADVGRAYEFNRSILNMSRDEFLLLLGQEGVDIRQFSN